MPFVYHPLKCHYCGKRIPQRVVLALLLHLALQVSYNLRVVLNVAIVEMVAPTAKKNSSEVACPNFEIMESGPQKEQYEWPQSTKALVLYAFYIGYVTTQAPGGWIADHYGGRWVLFTCILLSVISNVVFPLLTKRFGYIAAVVLRAILGCAQGPVLPTISSFVSRWIPQRNRTLLGGIAYGGSNLGTILGSIITGYLITGFNGWAAAFYFWSALASGYLVLHVVFVYSLPTTHPFIDQDESDFIIKEITINVEKRATPWKEILTNVPYWANISGQFGHNYIFFTLVTYLPTYMREILQFDIEQNGFYSALPFIALWLSSLLLSFTGSYFVNVLKCMTPHTFSKVFGTGSNMVSAGFALAAVYAGCNRHLCLTFYVFCMIAKAFYYMTLPVNINALSKNYSGVMFGICNGLSSFSGIIGPAIIGALTQKQTLGEWKTAFWITFGITVVTSVFYIFWSSGERQLFDYEAYELANIPNDEAK